MKVDWNKRHCGLSAKDMRKFLIHLRNFNLYDGERTKKEILQVYDIFKLQPRLSKINFVKSLLEEGFILQQKRQYVVTDKAIGFSNAKFMQRITKTKAESIVNDVVNRATEINTNTYYIGKVNTIKVFGSYIDPMRKDCGDIDLIVDIKKKKNISDEEVTEISYQRTENKTMSFIDRTGYAVCIEPLKYLKNKNKYLSFCQDNPSKHKCETIYEYKEK